MQRMNTIRVAVLVACAAACGCSQTGSDSPSSPSLITAPLIEAGENMQLTALLPDVIIGHDDGCIVARPSTAGPTRHVLVFPAHYELGRAGDGSLAIIDPSGRVWGHVGEKRTLGGGEVPAPPSATNTSCPGPFWLVATNSPHPSSASQRPPPHPEGG